MVRHRETFKSKAEVEEAHFGFFFFLLSPHSLTVASRGRLLQPKEEAVALGPTDQVEFPGSVRQVMRNSDGGQDWDSLSDVVLLALAVSH